MAAQQKRRVVVLHSGGLDSTVCLRLAVQRGHEVLSLGVNYNQTHLVELHYAAKECAALGVPRKVVNVVWEKPDRHVPTNRSLKEIKTGVSTAFLPGRNGVFLMLAAAEAAGQGAHEVWTGLNSVDFSGYPDARAEFVESFQRMLAFAIPKGPRIVAPLQQKSKPQIARMAKKLGLSQFDTWSCYRPVIASAGLVPCEACDACKLHQYAWSGIKGNAAAAP
jgi:7-cyano-7-deazaguanine synthase